MEGLSKTQNCFLIDVSGRRVFCRTCRSLCRKLVQAEAVRYWCSNHDCGNSGEVVLLPDGSWNVYGIVESWYNNQCSAFSSKLLFSQTSAGEGRTPHDPTPE